MTEGSAAEILSEVEGPCRFGGAGRDRTGGLIVANDALSQLSYSPTRMSRFYHQASGVRLPMSDCAYGRIPKLED
jgi:hypothetical protein